MPNATLADIDSALNTALVALVSGPPVAATPFAVAARYAGQVTKRGLSNVVREQYPAVLLRFDGEAITRDVLVWGAMSEEVGDASWSVIVVAEDPREVDEGMVGNAATPGALRLLDSALGAVNALVVANTYQGITLRAAETRPEFVEEGVVYAFSARIVARRVIPQAVNPDPAADLPLVQPIIGAENLIDGHGDTTDVNPLVTFQSDPNP
jgi:hypothetical protein